MIPAEIVKQQPFSLKFSPSADLNLLPNYVKTLKYLSLALLK